LLNPTAYLVYSCLISIVVFGFQTNNVCVGYDVATLSENLDWIAVMTYDYHGQWDKITGHVAPMYPHPDDIDVTFNAVSHLYFTVMPSVTTAFCILQLYRQDVESNCRLCQ